MRAHLGNRSIIGAFAVGLILMTLFAAQAASQTKSVLITISRKHSDSKCVSGYLLVDGKAICYALERPWKLNLPEISSISAGTYDASVRTDKNKWRIELKDVPGTPGFPSRKNIQIHSGNTPADSTGCILVGNSIDNNLCAITDSKNAMGKLAIAIFGTPPLPDDSIKLKVRIEDSINDFNVSN